MIDLRFNYPVTEATAAVVQAELARLVQEQPQQLKTFLPVELDLPVREVLARQWTRRGQPVAPEQVFLATTGHNAMATVLTAVLQPGDAIAADPITYGGLMGLADYFGFRLVAVPADGEGMDPDALAAAVQTAGVKLVYLMPNVHNPLGTTMGLARRAALVAVARQHNLWMVDDDAYGFLEPDPLPTLVHLAPERALYLQSQTKPLLSAVKVAMILAPEALSARIHAGIRFTSHGPSRLFVALLEQLIETGQYADILKAKQAEARSRQQLAQALLGSHYPAGTVQESFHFWVPLTAPQAETTYAALAAGGVGVLSHRAFAIGAAAGPGIRVALGGENDPARLRQALEIIANTLPT